ncbi:Rap/ran-GAP protein [Mortierella sp. AD094]|nr:Rap/ran-GAP protein [Mortierella sp. AD094]
MVPPETSSSNPVSGLNTLYKDTMNTFSTTQQDLPADIKPTPTPTPPLTTTTSLIPLTSSTTQMSTVPSVSTPSSPTATLELCLPTTTDNPSTLATLVHNQTSTSQFCDSPENNCINMPYNHNIGTNDSASINSSDSSDHNLIQPLPPADVLDLEANNASPAQITKSRSGSKSFGFFGSLSPKNSRQKLSKRNKESRSASPSSTAILTTGSTPPSTSAKPIFSEHGANNVSSQSVASISGTKELKDGSQQRRPSDSKRQKDKENNHPHLGQRISKAMGLTSSSSSKDQQRGRRESEDSLSNTDGNDNNQPSTPDESSRQRESPNPDKDRKGGLVSQFLRHRVMSSSDVNLTRSQTPSPATRKVEEKRAGGLFSTSAVKSTAQSNNLVIPAQPLSLSFSTTDGGVSAQSRNKEGDESKGIKSEKSWQTTPGRYGFGHGGSGKSVMNPSLFNHRRGSLQIQIPQMHPQSIADIMESSREVHPHHNPDDFERQDLCSRLGLTVGERPIESMNNHMYNVLAKRRGSLNPVSTDTRAHILSQSNNLFASNSSIDSSASATSPATSTKPPSRLARLTRFKFPSISVGSMHKNKSSTALSSESSEREPILNNIRRGSLPALKISSQLESSIRKLPVIRGSGSDSTFALVNTTALAGMIPGSSTYSSIHSNRHDLNVTSVGDGKKPRQSLSGFLEGPSHHPHHSSTAISNTGQTSATSSFSHRQIVANHEKGSHNTLPQYHRSTSRNNFGSERFTSSTSGSHDREQGPPKAQGNGFGGGIRSGILKRTSRRTVSASHISSDSIFAACEPESAEGSDSKNQTIYPSVGKQFLNEWDMQSTAVPQTESDTKTILPAQKTNRGAGSVGQYLFGDELRNISFGEAEAGSTMKIGNTEVASSTALSQPGGVPSSTGLLSAQSKAAAPLNAKKSSSSIRNSVEASISSANRPSFDSMIRDHAVATRSASAAPGDSSSGSSGRPLLSSANVNAKSERYGGLSHYTFPPTPPAASATSSTQVLKSKFSIIGSGNNHSTLSSLIPGRHSFSHNQSSASATITSALNLATSTAAKPSMKSNSHQAPRPSVSRNPNVPHLEPRSAVADYTPIIHYKRQRSMSLQDADLLTADQFIALLPDDLPTKRRFSSEEAPPENNWYTALKIKKAPQPDPSSVLRSLLSTLQSKCGLIIKHLDATSPSTPDLSVINATVDAGTEEDVSLPRAAAIVNDADEVFAITEPTVPRPRVSVSSPAILSNPPSHITTNHSESQRYVTETARPADQMRVAEILHSSSAGSKGTERDRDHGYPERNTDSDDFDGQIEFSEDSLDIVTTLFDEMDHTVSQMTEILAKYISTEQFSKLSKELDEMCFLAQTVIRTEIDKRGMQNEEFEKFDDHDTLRESTFDMPQIEREQISTRKSLDFGNAATTAATAASIATTSTAAAVVGTWSKSEASLKVDTSEEKQVRNKASMDMINNRQDLSHYKHQYRQPSDSQKSEDSSDVHLKTNEEQKLTVKNYVSSLLSTAESCVAEYMRVYNRMFVVPTTGYRIEGCNDLKKIERALRPDHPHTPSLPISMTTSEGASQPSLLSRASIVQNSTESATHDSTDITKSSVDARSDSVTYLHPTSSSSSINLSGQPMARVKSLPESNEWAELQKRKEMGGSAGVAGAISMGTPVSAGSLGGSNSGTGVTSGPDILTLGDYSKEHMGHEAYYYRTWFLGKEHRTYVGQVEGLGTVIISIIKDMVVPTESRPPPPGRSNTGPLISSSMASSSSVASTLSLPVTYTAGPSSFARPELVHASHNFYPARGAGLGSSGGGGGNLVAGPRPSSEAMRIILSASTAVATGSGNTSDYISSPSTMASAHTGFPSTTTTHPSQAPMSASSNSAPVIHQPNAISTSHGGQPSAPPRWQYRCILRQKDVDSLRITLPEPEPSPLNNLTRRVGKPQWKNILQSIHPAITQQVASKLKKVETNPHFEKELAKFDETMLRFNYKFGVLLVHPGQTKEEDWFSNQMTSSPRFQEFLESGALGQKVTLKGFERFSAGLDTRSDSGDYSYFDTWGEGFEIMYHVSTLLPFNTGDRQQIQRKRHIGNDIVCIVFVDGDHPFVPNTIKSQFLHIFVVIHPIVLPDGTRGYSAAIACDEQVPHFGPPLPDPSIFRTPQELRAFLLCKMINGENAAYKAPRLIKPHQRARSGMLENLVAKANCLTKDKDSDKKPVKQKVTGPPTSVTPSTSQLAGVLPASQPMMPGSHHASSTPITTPISFHQGYPHQYVHCHGHHGCQDQHVHHCPCENDRHHCCGMSDELQYHSHRVNGKKVVSAPPGPRTGTRTSLVSLGSETAASIFRARRRNSNSDESKPDTGFQIGGTSKEKERHEIPGTIGSGNSRAEGPGYIESLQSPSVSPLPSPFMTYAPTSSLGNEQPPFETSIYGNQDHDGSYSCCGCCCTVNCGACIPNPPSPYDDYKFPPPRPTSATTADKTPKSGAPQSQNTSGNSVLWARSDVSSPTEIQFAVNRNSFPNSERPHTRHSVGAVESLTVASSEKKDNAGTLGMSIGNNKGRSKSEIDLLLKTTPEGSQATIPKRPTVEAISSSLPSSYQTYNQGRSSYEIQQHHTGSSGPTAIPHANSNSGSTIAVPAHSSMKGRAHYFLTTLVRRRASSNDTSALGPTVHLGSKPSNLSPSSPLGTWSSAPGPSPHPHHQESASQASGMEQPLRFKEGYILKSKTPMHINTSIASSSNPQYPAYYQAPQPSASTLSSTSTSSLYTCSSLTSASLRSSAGTNSAFNFASNAMLPTPVSISGVFPQSLRSFSSRDALNRTSFSTDRRGSIDVLGSSRGTATAPTSWGSQRSGREELNDAPAVGLKSGTSSVAITPSSELTVTPLGPVDAANQTEWIFSESPTAYTTSFMRPTDSLNSIEVASASGSTLASASASAGGLSSSFPGSKTDYINFKPVTSPRDPIPRHNNSGSGDLALERRVAPSVSMSTHPFAVSAAADQNVAKCLPMECLALRDSHSLMAIENDPEHFQSTTTFASIPSSASANTTAAADFDVPNADLSTDFYDEALMENPIAGKLVKRAASVESFLRRDGVLVRIASLRLKGSGLQESIANARRPTSEALPSHSSRIDLHHQPHLHPLMLGDHGTSSKTTPAPAEKDAAADKQSPFTPQSQSLEAKDTETQVTAPSAMQSRPETRLRKISESQNSYCSLEVEQLDVKFEVVIN